MPNQYKPSYFCPHSPYKDTQMLDSGSSFCVIPGMVKTAVGTLLTEVKVPGTASAASRR